MMRKKSMSMIRFDRFLLLPLRSLLLLLLLLLDSTAAAQQTPSIGEVLFFEGTVPRFLGDGVTACDDVGEEICNPNEACLSFNFEGEFTGICETVPPDCLDLLRAGSAPGPPSRRPNIILQTPTTQSPTVTLITPRTLRTREPEPAVFVADTTTTPFPLEDTTEDGDQVTEPFDFTSATTATLPPTLTFVPPVRIRIVAKTTPAPQPPPLVINPGPVPPPPPPPPPPPQIFQTPAPRIVPAGIVHPINVLPPVHLIPQGIRSAGRQQNRHHFVPYGAVRPKPPPAPYTYPTPPPPVYHTQAPVYRTPAPVYRTLPPVYRTPAPVYRTPVPVYPTPPPPAYHNNKPAPAVPSPQYGKPAALRPPAKVPSYPAAPAPYNPPGGYVQSYAPDSSGILNCCDWAAHGHCDINPGFMRVHCQAACGTVGCTLLSPPETCRVTVNPTCYEQSAHAARTKQQGYVIIKPVQIARPSYEHIRSYTRLPRRQVFARVDNPVTEAPPRIVIRPPAPLQAAKKESKSQIQPVRHATVRKTAPHTHPGLNGALHTHLGGPGLRLKTTTTNKDVDQQVQQPQPGHIHEELQNQPENKKTISVFHEEEEEDRGGDSQEDEEYDEEEEEDGGLEHSLKRSLKKVVTTRRRIVGGSSSSSFGRSPSQATATIAPSSPIFDNLEASINRLEHAVRQIHQRINNKPPPNSAQAVTPLKRSAGGQRRRPIGPSPRFLGADDGPVPKINLKPQFKQSKKRVVDQDGNAYDLYEYVYDENGDLIRRSEPPPERQSRPSSTRRFGGTGRQISYGGDGRRPLPPPPPAPYQTRNPSPPPPPQPPPKYVDPRYEKTKPPPSTGGYYGQRSVSNNQNRRRSRSSEEYVSSSSSGSSEEFVYVREVEPASSEEVIEEISEEEEEYIIEPPAPLPNPPAALPYPTVPKFPYSPLPPLYPPSPTTTFTPPVTKIRAPAPLKPPPPAIEIPPPAIETEIIREEVIRYIPGSPPPPVYIPQHHYVPVYVSPPPIVIHHRPAPPVVIEKPQPYQVEVVREERVRDIRPPAPLVDPPPPTQSPPYRWLEEPATDSSWYTPNPSPYSSSAVLTPPPRTSYGGNEYGMGYEGAAAVQAIRSSLLTADGLPPELSQADLRRILALQTGATTSFSGHQQSQQQQQRIRGAVAIPAVHYGSTAPVDPPPPRPYQSRFDQRKQRIPLPPSRLPPQNADPSLQFLRSSSAVEAAVHNQQHHRSPPARISPPASSRLLNPSHSFSSVDASPPLIPPSSSSISTNLRASGGHLFFPSLLTDSSDGANGFINHQFDHRNKIFRPPNITESRIISGVGSFPDQVSLSNRRKLIAKLRSSPSSTVFKLVKKSPRSSDKRVQPPSFSQQEIERLLLAHRLKASASAGSSTKTGVPTLFGSGISIDTDRQSRTSSDGGWLPPELRDQLVRQVPGPPAGPSRDRSRNFLPQPRRPPAPISLKKKKKPKNRTRRLKAIIQRTKTKPKKREKEKGKKIRDEKPPRKTSDSTGVFGRNNFIIGPPASRIDFSKKVPPATRSFVLREPKEVRSLHESFALNKEELERLGLSPPPQYVYNAEGNLFGVSV